MSLRVDLQPDQRAALAKLLTSPKYEMIPLKHAREQAAFLPSGASITVTASPSKGMDATLDLAEVLTGAGFSLVPHISARQVRDRAHLRSILARLGSIGIDRAFVVGGDAPETGSFPDGFSLLREMAEIGHDLAEIGIPGYPEGHPFISDDDLLQALHDKQSYAHYIATQMCFHPAAIIGWIRWVRSEGVELPIHLGASGVSEITRLIEVAASVGIGDSMRYLRKNSKLLGRLVRPGAYSADVLLENLAAAMTAPAMAIEAIHIFTFNQVETTQRWLRELIEALGY
ncbi:MAG TPA: methylenetetrahydrofolate reductase [Acidimicrobiia bacterium]|nr:methylenetetrahydrofolate reductase [Acidimicrobiia bacterium]